MNVAVGIYDLSISTDFQILRITSISQLVNSTAVLGKFSLTG